MIDGGKEGMVTWSMDWMTDCPYCGRKNKKVTDETMIVTKIGDHRVHSKHRSKEAEKGLLST
jgi:hypothetical protein